MYGDQFGEFVCGFWDLKGLIKLQNVITNAINFNTSRR